MIKIGQTIIFLGGEKRNTSPSHYIEYRKAKNVISIDVDGNGIETIEFVKLRNVEEFKSKNEFLLNILSK